MHKLCSRGNDVGIEALFLRLLLLRDFDAFLGPLLLDVGRSFKLLLRIDCSSESSRSLLVHFCSWCNSIDGEVNGLSWLDDADDLVCVLKNQVKHLLFTLRLWSIQGMAAWMNNSVHVEVKIVNLRIVLLNLSLD